MKNGAEERKESRRMIKKGFAGVTALLLLLVILCAGGCRAREEGPGREESEEEGSGSEEITEDTSEESYGVFVGVDASSFRIDQFEGYDLVVVDAQELRAEQLAQLHSAGHTVYSYLNVGSLEKSRDYYRDYKGYCLDRYDNWPDEYWVDVTELEWQDFVTQDLTERILDKDPAVDGLFLDNLDVYSHLSEKRKYRDLAEDAYEALADILGSYQDQDLPVLINGADEFVTRLIEEGDQDLIRGVNQETVFSMIKDYDHDKFGAHSKEERKYYTDYLKTCKKAGLDVFLLEYTTDGELEEEIRKYCRRNGFRYYISAHVNLVPSDS